MILNSLYIDNCFLFVKKCVQMYQVITDYEFNSNDLLEIFYKFCSLRVSF